jgi:hypothetical protein
MTTDKIVKLQIDGQTRKLYKYQNFQPLDIDDWKKLLNLNLNSFLNTNKTIKEIDYFNDFAKSKNNIHDTNALTIEGPCYLFDMTGFAYFHTLYDKAMQYEFIKSYIPNLKLVPITYSNRPFDTGNIIYKDFLELYGLSLKDIINMNDGANYIFKEVYNFIFEHNEFLIPFKENIYIFDNYEAWSDPKGYEHYVKIGSKQLLKRVKSSLTENQNKKFFISRKKINDRDRKKSNFLYNTRFITSKDEERLESFFESIGYEIIFAEDYSLIKQIEIYSSASHIAGLKSSGFCNMVFSKPGTQIISINLDNSFECWYSDLARYFNLNYREIPALKGEEGGYLYQLNILGHDLVDYGIDHILDMLKTRYKDIL